MKRFFIFAGVLVVGLALGLVLGLTLAFVFAAPRKVGISAVTVSKQVIERQDVIIVDSEEHPPFAQQHLTSVEFDYDQKTISILRYAGMIPGFGHEIYSRWPVVIRNGLLPGDYTLRIWKSDGFVSVGRIVVADNRIEYVPRKDGP